MLVCYARDETANDPAGRCCRFAPFHAASPRRGRRYPTDTTDAQWELLDPLLPDPPFLSGSGGRPEAWCRRQIVDAILYVVDNGIKWRALPADFPPHSTVFKYFARWEAAGATGTMLSTLNGRERLAGDRTAAPTAAVIDSASV
ncbi:MAG: transposase, partial [Gemmatimonadales bacterium]